MILGWRRPGKVGTARFNISLKLKTWGFFIAKFSMFCKHPYTKSSKSKLKYILNKTGDYLKNLKIKIIIFDLIGVLFNKKMAEGTVVYEAYNWALDLVNLAKKSNYSLFWCSNMSSKSFSQLRGSFENVFDNFDGGILSDEVGVVKPNPAIWLTLINKYTLNISEILYLDDQLNNILAARQLGIISVQVISEVETKKILNGLGVLS